MELQADLPALQRETQRPMKALPLNMQVLPMMPIGIVIEATKVFALLFVFLSH